MRQIFSLALFAILLYSCTDGQVKTTTKTELSATEFATKIKELPTATIVDVRTPGEFSQGHIANAKNYNWRGDDFEKQISPLDKSKPVLVYCLIGGRSAKAANLMRSEGFTTVYELVGGMLSWRDASLPETTANTVTSNGMTKQQFDALLNSDKLVLIDFYAEWCEPCKKMKPYLDEISKDMTTKVSIIRINADDNKEICKELKIDGLPVLKLYQNKSLVWSNTGFIEKEEVLKHLK